MERERKEDKERRHRVGYRESKRERERKQWKGKEGKKPARTCVAANSQVCGTCNVFILSISVELENIKVLPIRKASRQSRANIKSALCLRDAPLKADGDCVCVQVLS